MSAVMGRHRLLSWDWRTSLPSAELAAAIAEFAGGPIHACAVETGTDQHVLLLSEQKLTPDQAYQVWAAD